MRRERVTGARCLVVLVLVASALVPGWVRPLKAVALPRTLAHRVDLEALRAPKVRFDDFAPTHMLFSWRGPEGTGIRYRLSGEDGEVSAWSRAPESHDMETRRRHFSGILIVDRPAALEWEPVTPRGTRMSAPRLDYLNTMDGPRSIHTIPATAAASAETPSIVTRAEWGADESLKDVEGDCRRRFYGVQQLFVHHTVTSNDDPDPYATMRAIYHFHTQSRGWCDIGYNFLISADGTVFEGRWARPYRFWEAHDSESTGGAAVAGAHVSGFNSGSVGVSLMGDYSQASLPPGASRSLVNLLAWEADRHDLAPEACHLYQNPETGAATTLPVIAGHRDAGSTACPGDNVYRALPAIREQVALLMQPSKRTTRLTLKPSARDVLSGRPVTIEGRLRAEDGTGLPGRSLRLFTRRPRRSWRQSADLVTGPGGEYSATIEPGTNLRVATSYEGDVTTWGQTSRVATVIVHPRVTLRRRQPGSRSADGTIHFAPGTSSVALGGRVVPAHAGGVRVRIYRMRSTGPDLVRRERSPLNDAGAYAYRFRHPVPGVRYRVRVRFPSHFDHGYGRSRALYLQVDR